MNRDKGSGWNYRVVKTIYPSSDGELAEYQIHEVYYTNDKPDGLSKNGMSPSGDSVENLVNDFERFKKAFSKPCIVYDEKTNAIVGEEQISEEQISRLNP